MNANSPMLRLWTLLFVAFLVLLPMRSAQVASQTHQSLLPLANVLNPDGTLNLTRDFSASLDPEGWTMLTDARGQPRFVRTGPDSPARQMAAVGSDERGQLPRPAANAALPAAYPTPIPPDPTWDNRFDLPGVNGIVYALAVADNDLYVGGSFLTAGGLTVNNIARWNGQEWSELGGGVACTEAASCNRTGPLVQAIAVQGSDVYVGGQFDLAGTTRVGNLAHWDGHQWSDMGGGITCADTFRCSDDGGAVKAIAIQGSDVYVGGQFTSAGTTQAGNIGRWDGTQWFPVGNQVTSQHDTWVYALASRGDTLYVGGAFTRIGGISANHIASWDGHTWRDLAGGTDNAVRVLALDHNFVYVGVEVIGGYGTSALLTWDGQTWTTVGMPGQTVMGVPYALAVIDGDIWVGGDLWAPEGSSFVRSPVTHWNGTAWTTPPRRLDNLVYALTVDGAQIVMGGRFVTAGDAPARGVVTWDGADWAALAGSHANGVTGVVQAIAMSEGNTYVGGSLSYAGATPVNRIAKWDGQRWSTLGSGIACSESCQPGAQIRAIAISGEHVYVGGRFDRAGDVAANNIALWDGHTWSALGAGIRAESDMFNMVYPEGVYAIVVHGTDVYVGGSFREAGDIAVNSLARWDGTRWSDVGGGVTHANFPNNLGLVAAMAWAGRELIVGGDITHAGGAEVRHIARWDGQTWRSLGDGLTTHYDCCPAPTVRAITAAGTDVYVGGAFSRAGTVAAFNLARWDGANWWPVGELGGVPGDSYSHISAVAVDGSHVFVTGAFSSIAGTSAQSVAKWDGERWWSLSDGRGGGITYGEGAGVVADGRNVYVGGSFQRTDSWLPSYNFGHWYDPLLPTPTPRPVFHNWLPTVKGQAAPRARPEAGAFPVPVTPTATPTPAPPVGF